MKQIQCTCVTADIINSRDNNKSIYLEGIVKELNRLFSDQLVTKFCIRAGDEMFGILQGYKLGFNAVKELYAISSSKEIPLYVGIGLGSIESKNINDPNRVNGSAIWNSADALALLKEDSQQTKHFQNQNDRFKYFIKTSDNGQPYMIINYLFYFTLEKIMKRTAKQSKVIEMIKQNPDINYGKLGQLMGYKKNESNSISKLLIRAEYSLVTGAEESAAELLAFYEYLEKDDSTHV